MTKPPTPPVLVVFDIDGTLLASAGEHHGIIVEVLGRRDLDVLAKPWASYRNYTDSAVIDEVIQDTHGRSVTPAELAEFDAEYLDAFVTFLEGTDVVEVPGARRLLDDLADLEGVHVAFATGSLRSMAVRKLQILDVDAQVEVLATGSEHGTREDIVSTAIAQAQERSGEVSAVVVLGDGPWDERTAVALGIPFVAVQTGSHVFGDVPVRTVRDLTELSAAELVSYAAVRPTTGVHVS